MGGNNTGPWNGNRKSYALYRTTTFPMIIRRLDPNLTVAFHKSFTYLLTYFEGHSRDILSVVTLCAQLTCDLLAIAKFLVTIRQPRPQQIIKTQVKSLVSHVQLLYRPLPGHTDRQRYKRSWAYSRV